MKWPLLGALFAVAACQSSEPKAAPTQTVETGDTKIIQLPKAEATEAYRKDITSLCDGLSLSGADKAPKDEQWTVLAMWLGPNIKTDQGREFLVAIQPLQGDAKALALETEGKRVGLAKCALADAWR
jgi:hypothetical protein